ncbi:sialin-like [Drosophila bipectinata]|uniref:sialin-like n=1 Tax=Drosophila bipectinata TaxID=42026 RepID=UPI001C8AF842|nr:sialin-like [Drosophila bipectinata]
MPAEVAAKSSIFFKYVPFRYVFAVLGSIGIAIVYGLNIYGIIMAQMVHDDKPYIAVYVVLSYYCVYVVSQIPLARVAEKYSAKWVMLFSVAINLVCTLLTPVLTEFHFGGHILMRVMEGIVGGASFPAMHVMIASWAPPTERMVMSAIIYVGTNLSIPLAGVLSEQSGWESVFYVMGPLGCIWMVLWIIFVQDNPNKQRFISREERQMINSSLGAELKEDKNPAVPWKKVFTSVPFWAILIAHTCYELNHWPYLIQTSDYMKQALDINFEAPLLGLYSFTVIFSILLYCLQNKGKVSATCARKITTAIFLFIPGACLIFLCCIGYLQNGAVTVMSVGFVSMEAMFPCFLSNHVDIAPNFAGTLVALANSAAYVTSSLVFLSMKFVIAEQKSIETHRIIFGFKIALFAITFLVLIIFGSGKEQSWNKNEKNEDENITLKKITNLNCSFDNFDNINSK